MTQPRKTMQTMAKLTKMVLDVEMAALKSAVTAREATLAKLSGLRADPIMMDDTHGASEALAALRYQTWAEGRRAELQINLARQTAIWLDARDQARTAFGKSEAVNHLAQKMAQQALARRRP